MGILSACGNVHLIVPTRSIDIVWFWPELRHADDVCVMQNRVSGQNGNCLIRPQNQRVRDKVASHLVELDHFFFAFPQLGCDVAGRLGHVDKDVGNAFRRRIDDQ